MASVAFPTRQKTITVSDGTVYGFIRVEPKLSKPTLLFLHGYPSSSYHWHNQVEQSITAGYGVIAPDLLGYGDTSKPTDSAAYDNTILAEHIIEILDKETEKDCSVIGVGHDWGSIFLSTIIRLYPARFTGLIFLTVGYLPTQALFQDIDAVNAQFIQDIGRPLYGYWGFFDKPEAASILEKADPLVGASLLFPSNPSKIWIENLCEPGATEAWVREGKTTDLAPWLSLDELQTHGQILVQGGFTGPLNWYKQAMAGVTHASESRFSPDYASTKVDIPTLFVGSKHDLVCTPEVQTKGFKGLFSDLTIEITDTGHWSMIEKPEELWEVVQGWIERKGK